MTITEQLQLVTLVVVILSGIAIPFVLHKLQRQDADRTEMRREIARKFDHLDECVDTLKNHVLGDMVARTEIIAFKADMTETLNRIRIAISNETDGLHQRIMRLENKVFDGGH